MRAEKQIRYPDHQAPRMRGEVIRRYRNQRGYTQAHVANLLGVEESAYSKRERTGIGLDSVERLYELAQVLDIDFIELVRIGCPQPDLDHKVLLDTIIRTAQLLRDRNSFPENGTI